MFFQCCCQCRWQLISGGTKRSLCINPSLVTCESVSIWGTNPQIPAGDRRISGHPHLPVTLIPPSPRALSALSVFWRQQSHNSIFFFWKKQYKLCCRISVLVANNLFLSISHGRLREKRRGLGFKMCKQSQNKPVLPGSAQRTIKSQLLNPRHSWNFTWI